MNKLWKRMLALTLTFVMVFGMLPTQALTAELGDGSDGQTVEQVETPTEVPTEVPTETPTEVPTEAPTEAPTEVPATEETQHTHDYEETVTTAATCTADGVKSFVCSCGDVYTETIAASGHTYENGVCACGDTEPTEVPTDPPTEDPTEAPVMAPAPTEDPALAKVQELIASLPDSVNSQEEYDAVYDTVAEIEEGMYELTGEQMDKIFAAMDAADAWFNADLKAGAYAEADGWYWVDSNLYIKNGSLTKGKLYAALTDKFGSASSGNLVKGYYYGNKYTNVTSSTDSAAVSLSHDQSLQIWKTTGSGWTAKQVDQGSITVKHYYEVTAQVADGSPAGAGISVEPKNVVKGGSTKVTVSAVDGYSAAVTDSKGNAVTDLAAYAPTESTVLTVTYTSNAVAKYTVTVEEVNGEWGSAILKSDDELIAGAAALVEVTPIPSESGSVVYTVESVTVGETALTANENGYYVYTMGEADAAIKVTFAKHELAASKNDAVKFNPFVGYKDQMEGDAAKADVAGNKSLEQSILDSLGMTYNDAKLDPADVTIKYVPKWSNWGKYEFCGSESEITKLGEDIKKANSYTTYAEFGTRYDDGDKAERVVIEYKVSNDITLSLTRDITLTEGRSGQSVALDETYTEAAPFAYKTAEELDAHIASILKVTAGDGTIASIERATALSGTDPQQITYNVAVSETAACQALAATVTTWAAMTAPATVSFVNADETKGTGTVDFGGLAANGTLAAGTYTLTVTPTDLNGADGSAMYVEKVEVNDVELAGTYNNGVFTASYTVVNDETYTFKVTYGTAKMEGKTGTLELNGYVEAGGFLQADTYYRWNNLKDNILIAVLGSYGNVDDYTVSAWLNLVGDPAYRDVTNVPGTSEYRARLEVPAYGKTGSLKVKIVKAASSDGKVVALTLADIEVPTKESRPFADLKDYTETEAQAKEYGSQDALTAYVTGLANGSAVNPNGLSVTVSTGSQWPTVAGVATKMVYTVKYADSADYIGDEAAITVYAKAKHNNCTVVADSALTENGSLTVSGTVNNDGKTVLGNSTVTITVNPGNGKYVEGITVKNGDETVTVSAITYDNRKASVTFTSDGSKQADEYVVSAEIKDNYLTLKEGQTIVYCVDDEDHAYDLQKLVFEAVFGGSSAPMTKDNVTLEFKYGGLLGIDGWADISKGPAINLGSLTHKFGEEGSETIRLKYADAKYGSFEQEILLNVFDSCYNAQVNVNTVTNGANATIKTQFSEDARKYLGVNYFKAGTELTVTLTPDGDLLNVLEQLYNGTYSESMAYIKSVTVTDKNGNVIPSTVIRGQGKLDIGSILQGVNPMLYNASVTFTPAADEAYTVTVEYAILELQRENETVQMPMYQGGETYDAEVPSAQEIVNAVLGEEYAANFLAAYGGAFTVEFSTDLISYKWTEVSDAALLALENGAKVRVRITWKETEGTKTYYPVAQQADLTLEDPRTPTSVVGTVPEKQVNYLSEDKLIAELKEAMGLGIAAEESPLDVDCVVTYTIEGNETDGFFAAVTVAYGGSSEYKPTSKTFENVPVANRPDDTTIKVSIQNASAVVTNNDGKVQVPDPETGIYTVIGNGTYTFKLTPEAGFAIESVTVTASEIKNTVAAAAEETVELSYEKQAVSFSMMLDEKHHYEIEVKTVDSVWVLEDERIYDFAPGITKPDNADIVDAAAKLPTDIDFEKATVEYLARAEGKVTVTLPDIDLGFYVIELGTFDIDLGELWLDPETSVDMVSEDQLDKILANLVDDVIFKVSHGELAAANALSYITNYVKNLPLGIHAFGANGDGSTETVRFSYEDQKYLLTQIVTDVTIHDYRIATEIKANDCEVTFGYSTEQLVAAAGAYVDADGDAVSGLKVETEDLYLHAKNEAQKATLTFAGDENYQPSKVTIDVIVNKAPVSIDYDSQQITYGDEYDLALSVSPSVMPDGTKANVDRIEMMIGLEMNKLLDLDISDKKVGLDQAIAYIQLRLPESIRNLPLVGENLQGEFTLGEFTNLIGSLSDVLGIDENSLGVLNQVIEAITGVTDNMDIKVIIKDNDFHPKNIGVYIAGAVTVDSDFETAYTADYLLILPKTTQATLVWDYTDENGIMTLPAYNEIFTDLMGAHVVEEELSKNASEHIKYLLLGINDDTSEFLTTDIYGNIKANIWATNDMSALTLDNGAYVQIAYLINWGNEIFYAMPIVRSFVVVPSALNVKLVGETGTENREMMKVFDNEPQGFSVKVTNNKGKLIYSDHYQSVVNKLGENAEITYNYVGVQTNGKDYHSNEKPVHAGVYAAVVTVVDKDAEGNILAVGADAGLLVIEPSESSVSVEDVIHTFGTRYNLENMIAVDSINSGVTPDTTVISAMLAATGDVSANGLAGITGTVNVDFPRWVDALIAEHVPGVKDGITVAELQEKLLNNIPDISAKLEELGATPEIINAMSNLIGNVSTALEQLPGDVKLTFRDDVELYAVGAYLVMAVVTDSDHYPAMDTGLLIIAPDATKVVLKYEEDANNIFTPEALKVIDLGAKAYDPITGEEIENATAKVTNLFVGVNAKGETVVTDDPSALDNGVYTEFSYILDVGGKMYYAEPISRIITLAPNTADVYFVDAKGNKNNDQLFVFDNTAKSMAVKAIVNDKVFTPAAGDLTYYYVGVQTNGETYNSTEHPVHAGVYAVTVSYTTYDDNGKLLQFGAAMGAMAIEPADSSIEVSGETVTYDGKGHTAAVVAIGSGVTEPDYTLISGGAYVTGDISEVGVDAFHGNVNIDLPAWLDEALAEHEFTDGVNASKLADYVTAYRDELIAGIPMDKLVEWNIGTEEEVNAAIAKLNAYVDELVAVLKKLPADVALTFVDDITYTEPGAYLYYGIVTDSDHYPAADTGLLVIEKMDIVFDLLDTTVTWNGNGRMVDLNNPKNADFVTVVINRENNTINIVLDQDAQFALNAVAKILGVAFDGDVQMSTILEKFNGQEVADAIIKLISDAQKLELTDEVKKVLAAVKAEMETLPENGTITVGDELPSEVGEYEVYAISYSQHFKTSAAEAVLKIVPVQVEVVLNGNSKVYGDADPELTYTVNCYDHLGNKLADAGVVDVTVVREAGEDVDTYAISAVAELTDDAHYVLIAQPEDTVFKITPAVLTVTAENKTKVYGDADPELTVKVEGLVNGDTLADLNVEIEREAGENVGTYEITTKAENDNYVITIHSGTLTITRKEAKITREPQAIEDLVYNGDDLKLAEEGSAEGGTFLYSLSKDGPFTTEIPVGKDAGTYTVYYKIAGDENHEDSEVKSVTVTISKATPDVQAPAGLTAFEGQTLADVKLPDGFSWEDAQTSSVGSAGENKFYVIYTPADSKNYETVRIPVTIDVTKKATGLYPIPFDPDKDTTGTIVPGGVVEIDGVPYVLDENCTVWVAQTTAKIATTYTYHVGENTHETYPTHMYVWYLTIVDEDSDGKDDVYTAERVVELDDFFKYEGTSIRINFTSNGIRFFTSIDAGKRIDLINGTLLTGNLKDFKMTQAGTLYKRYTGSDSVITNETGISSDVYGGKAGSVFRIFSTVNSRNWYTGMLTGLDGDPETLDMDIQSRPFATLQRDGETIVLYGGTVQRSIYYVATQNRDVWPEGSVYDNYIEDLIAIVENAKKNA